MNSELTIGYLEEKNLIDGLNKEALAESLRIASEIFV
jgi:hypothetical protein